MGVKGTREQKKETQISLDPPGEQMMTAFSFWVSNPFKWYCFRTEKK